MKPTTSACESTAASCHNYAAKMDVSTECLKRKDPFSPAKKQRTAKMKGSTADGGTKVVLEAIKQLTDKVDAFGTQIQQNSMMLASMAKAVEFYAVEIIDCKTQIQTTEREVLAIKKDNAELMEIVLELERYKRRWNLRIRGIKEKEGENTQEVVANLLVKISPPWVSTTLWTRLTGSADRRKIRRGRSSFSSHREYTGTRRGR